MVSNVEQLCMECLGNGVLCLSHFASDQVDQVQLILDLQGRDWPMSVQVNSSLVLMIGGN